MSVTKPEINYEVSHVDQGTYSYNRVLQQSGGTTVSLTASGGNTSVFEISPAVINLAKSYFSFTLSTPDAAQATVCNAYFTQGIPCIRSIQLSTRSGAFLVDVQNSDKYLAASLPIETTRDEAIRADRPRLVAGVPKETFSGLCLNNGTQTTLPNVASGTDATTPYDGLLYFLAASVSGAAGTVAINYQIPLSQWKGTLLAHPQDLFFQQSVYLTVTWNTLPKIGCLGTTIAITAGQPVALASAIVSKLYLNCALEQNSVAQAVARANKTIPINFLYQNAISLPSTASTTNSVQVRYSKSQGNKLRKLIVVPFNGSETFSGTAGILNGQYDHDNTPISALEGRIISSYFSTLNGQRLEQWNPIIGNYEDFALYREQFKESVMSRSETYYRNWCVVTDFTAGRVPWEGGYLDAGLSLDDDLIYTFNSTTSATQLVPSILYYVWAITERLLSFRDGEITIA